MKPGSIARVFHRPYRRGSLLATQAAAPAAKNFYCQNFGIFMISVLSLLPLSFEILRFCRRVTSLNRRSAFGPVPRGKSSQTNVITNTLSPSNSPGKDAIATNDSEEPIGLISKPRERPALARNNLPKMLVLVEMFAQRRGNPPDEREREHNAPWP